VLAVCHSVVVLVFRRLLEQWDEAKYIKIDSEGDVLTGSVTSYKYDRESDKLVLDDYNAFCCPEEPR
jgi:hypothetical protein